MFQLVCGSSRLVTVSGAREGGGGWRGREGEGGGGGRGRVEGEGGGGRRWREGGEGGGEGGEEERGGNLKEENEEGKDKREEGKSYNYTPSAGVPARSSPSSCYSHQTHKSGREHSHKAVRCLCQTDKTAGQTSLSVSSWGRTPHRLQHRGRPVCVCVCVCVLCVCCVCVCCVCVCICVCVCVCVCVVVCVAFYPINKS